MLQQDRDGIPSSTTATQLTSLLAHCERQVPYYAEQIRKTQGSYMEDPVSYLTRFPVLTKDIIRARSNDLRSGDLQFRKWYFNTSGGSTGEPVILIQDRESAARAGAVKLLFSKLAGREIGEPEIELWGSTRDIARRSEKLRAQLLLRLANTTILDGFVMTPIRMRQYIAVLNRVRPKLIVAYAGAVYELAKFAEREGLEVKPQAAVMTSAEMLHPFMREKIEKVFQTTVYDRYGSREVGDIACERPGYRGFWVAPWGNYLEIIDREGRRLPDGEEGDIAITSLTNYAMPLIRYRIGDRGVLAPRQSTGAPRHVQVLRAILGRSTDMVHGKEGKLIDSGYFEAMLYYRPWIRRYQVIQKSPSRIVFRIVSGGVNCPQTELDEIVSKTRLEMGVDCEVEFEFPDEIPTSESGKYRYVISEIRT